MRKQIPDWKKIFANGTSDKGLFSKIQKEFLKFNAMKATHFKKWAKDLKNHLTK